MYSVLRAWHLAPGTVCLTLCTQPCVPARVCPELCAQCCASDTLLYVQGLYLTLVLSILFLVCVHAWDRVSSVVCPVLCAWCCVSSSVCPALYVAWCCLELCVRNCVPGVWTWPCGLRVCARCRVPGSVFPEFWSCRVYAVCASGTYCSLVSSVLCSQISGLAWGASQGLSGVCVCCWRSCA